MRNFLLVNNCLTLSSFIVIKTFANFSFILITLLNSIVVITNHLKIFRWTACMSL